MTTSTDQFYLDQPEPNRSCLLAMRQLILEADERLYETRKYGMPCFCVGKKACCYLWTDKKTNHPYLLMVEGNRLQHSALEAGDRKRMKVLPVDPNQDVPVSLIQEVLEEALKLY